MQNVSCKSKSQILRSQSQRKCIRFFAFSFLAQQQSIESSNIQKISCPFCNRSKFTVVFTGPKKQEERQKEEEVCIIYSFPNLVNLIFPPLLRRKNKRCKCCNRRCEKRKSSAIKKESDNDKHRKERRRRNRPRVTMTESLLIRNRMQDQFRVIRAKKSKNRKAGKGKAKGTMVGIHHYLC